MVVYKRVSGAGWYKVVDGGYQAADRSVVTDLPAGHVTTISICRDGCVVVDGEPAGLVMRDPIGFAAVPAYSTRKSTFRNFLSAVQKCLDAVQMA